MGRLILKPKLNCNFGRAVYWGILYAIFRFCSDILAVRYFGANQTTMVVLASLMGFLLFAYLVYMNLELQDRIDKYHPESGNDDRPENSKEPT